MSCGAAGRTDVPRRGRGPSCFRPPFTPVVFSAGIIRFHCHPSHSDALRSVNHFWGKEKKAWRLISNIWTYGFWSNDLMYVFHTGKAEADHPSLQLQHPWILDRLACFLVIPFAPSFHVHQVHLRLFSPYFVISGPVYWANMQKPFGCNKSCTGTWLPTWHHRPNYGQQDRDRWRTVHDYRLATTSQTYIEKNNRVRSKYAASLKDS